MRTKVMLVMIIVGVLYLAGLLGLSVGSGAVTAAPPAVPDAPEVAAVKQAILTMREVTSEAYYTLDVSRLSSVYVNDNRGGDLSDIQQKHVRSEWKETSDSRLNNPLVVASYLDYQLAGLNWLKRGVEKREALQRKATSEGRSLTTQEQQSLVDTNGQLPPARAERPSEPLSQPTFEAITVNGDTTIAVVDGGPVTSQFTLVKVDGKWLTAGEKVLSVHF